MRVEKPASEPLAYGHQQVHIQADLGDLDTRIVLVRRREVGIVMMVVMPSSMGV